MKIIKTCFIIILALSFKTNLDAQTLKGFLNDSIKYTIVLSRIDGNEKNNFSELVLKTNLDPKLKKLFFQLPKKKLIAYLNDSATSWATNLMLYEKSLLSGSFLMKLVECSDIKLLSDFNYLTI